jgi:hypothetical protein
MGVSDDSCKGERMGVVSLSLLVPKSRSFLTIPGRSREIQSMAIVARPPGPAIICSGGCLTPIGFGRTRMESGKPA